MRLAKIDKKIELIQDEALNALNQLKMKNEDKFDFAFIDADKANYCKYYDSIIVNMMKNGGIICIDNTLWKGKVYDNNDKKVKHPIYRENFNEKIKTDKRVEHSMLTIYDGMTICYIKIMLHIVFINL